MNFGNGLLLRENRGLERPQRQSVGTAGVGPTYAFVIVLAILLEVCAAFGLEQGFRPLRAQRGYGLIDVSARKISRQPAPAPSR